MLAWVMNLGFAASDSGFVPATPISNGTFLMLGVGSVLLVMFLG